MTFEGLTPEQVKLLQTQLEAGFTANFVTLADRYDAPIADVRLK